MPRKKAEKPVEEQDEFEVDEPSEVEELENNATDDDWTPADDEKKQPGRPQRASRNRKPIKLTDGKSSDEEEEEEEDEEAIAAMQIGRGTKRKRGGGNTAVRGGGRGRGRGRGGGGAATASPAKKPKSDENGKGRGKKKVVAAPEGEAEEDEMEDVDEEGMDDDEESVSDEDDSDEDSTAEDDADIPEQFKSGKFVLLKSDFDNKEENYPLWKIDGKSLLQKFDKFMHNNEELYKGTTIYAGWSKTIIGTYYPITVELMTLDNGESTVKFDPSQITPEMQSAKSTFPVAGGDGDITTKEEPLEASEAEKKSETKTEDNDDDEDEEEEEEEDEDE